jgi:hypothetical protein
MLEVDIAEVNIWRAVTLDGLAATSAALPVGHTRSVNELRVEKITSANLAELKHTLLAVMHPSLPFTDGATAGGDSADSDAAGEDQEHQLLQSNVAGFVHVHDVNVEAGKITLLAPCPGQLPSAHLVAGDIFWVES